MEAAAGVTAEVLKIFAAKAERRQRLAGLSFSEKVQAVIQLQELAAHSSVTRQMRSSMVWWSQRRVKLSSATYVRVAYYFALGSRYFAVGEQYCALGSRYFASGEKKYA
ncbi:MAG TPA: hypothetical protein VK993_01710 [Chthoniobacterales bacterium]|nr:hypothetical protein [Chthoniobacterales bacterium]